MAQTVSWAYTGSYQEYTFTEASLCAFTVSSAPGGKGNAYGTSFGSEPGGGSRIQATFPFRAGDVIRLIVGGMGTGSTGTQKDGAAGGGGGASMVLLKIPAVEDARWDFTWGGFYWRPLLVAPGGGGTGDESYRNAKVDGAAGDVLHYFSPDNFKAYSTSTQTTGTTGCLGIQNLIANNGAGASYTRGGSTGAGGYGGGGSSDDNPSFGGGWAAYGNYQAGSWVYTPTAGDIAVNQNLSARQNGSISGTITPFTDASQYDAGLFAQGPLVAGETGVVGVSVAPRDAASAAVSRVELFIGGAWHVCTAEPTPPDPDPPDPDPPDPPDPPTPPGPDPPDPPTPPGPDPVDPIDPVTPIDPYSLSAQPLSLNAAGDAGDDGMVYCTLSPAPDTSFGQPEHVYACKVRVTNAFGTQRVLTEDSAGSPLTLRVTENVPPTVEVDFEDGAFFPDFPRFSVTFRDPPGTSASPAPSGLKDSSEEAQTSFTIRAGALKLSCYYMGDGYFQNNLEPNCLEISADGSDGFIIAMPRLDSRLAGVQGPVTVTLNAADNDGNTAQRAVGFTVDRQPPELAILAPQDGFVSSERNILVSGTAADNVGLEALSIQANNGPAQDLSGLIDPDTGQAEAFSASVTLRGGVNTVTLAAADTAGLAASRTSRGLHLVFDRTEADVLAGTEKGFYNASDLNRVGEAETDLAALCRALGNACAVSPKTDWAMTGIPTQAQMQTFIGHLNTFKGLFPYPDDMPPVPADMDHLDWQRANDIEELLYRWFFMVQSIRDSWFYAGEIFTGEVI